MEHSPVSRNAMLVIVAVVALILVSSHTGSSSSSSSSASSKKSGSRRRPVPPPPKHSASSNHQSAAESKQAAVVQKNEFKNQKPEVPLESIHTNVMSSDDCIEFPDHGLTAVLNSSQDFFHENPFNSKYITTDMRTYWGELITRGMSHSQEISKKYSMELYGKCDDGAPETLHECWQVNDGWKPRHGFSIDQTWKKVETCKCAEGNSANSSNWDMMRRDFCKKVNAELDQKYPFPKDLAPHLELSYKSGLDAQGDLKVPFAKPFCSGKPQGELPFNPVKVRNAFLQLQTALTIFYRGEKFIDGLMAHKASVGDSLAMDKLSDRFAGAIIRGGKFVISGIGDSTCAGADNCYFDNWMAGLERQMKPMFKTANLNLEMRNGAHNGGHGTAEQLECARSIAGEDTDLLLVSAPFVLPSDLGQEDFIRRALVSGIQPAIVWGARETNVGQYHKFGVLHGHRKEPVSPPYRWVPPFANRNYFWRRPGDKFCHFESTRSGSSAVRNRNWHPGPMGHQQMSDAMSYWLSSIFILALEKISKDLVDSKGKLAPLLTKWPRRVFVDPKEFTEDMATCQNKKYHDPTKHSIDVLKGKCGTKEDLGEKICEPMEVCGGGNPITHGLPTCLASLEPSYGPTFQDWIVDDKTAPQWAGQGKQNNGDKWILTKYGPYSKLPGYECPKNGKCGSKQEITPGVFELIRSTKSCDHIDSEIYYANQGSDWGTLKIPANTMKSGRISMCMSCGWAGNDPRSNVDARSQKFVAPAVKLQSSGGAFEKSFQGEELDWWNNGFGRHNGKNGACAIISRDLPANLHSKDMFVGFSCPNQKKGQYAILRYLYVQ